MGSPQLPPGAVCLYAAQTVDSAVDRLAVRLAVRLWDAHPVVVCLMNGALPFTADLLRRFYFDVELDHMTMRRYCGRRGRRSAAPLASITRGGRAVDVERPLRRSVAGRTVLLVDDVLDQGVTLKAAQQALAEAGAGAVLTAVLVRKAVPGAVAEADYAALEAPDEFLVGRGMDMGGAFRQLSAIYSLGAAPRP